MGGSRKDTVTYSAIDKPKLRKPASVLIDAARRMRSLTLCSGTASVSKPLKRKRDNAVSSGSPTERVKIGDAVALGKDAPVRSEDANDQPQAADANMEWEPEIVLAAAASLAAELATDEDSFYISAFSETADETSRDEKVKQPKKVSFIESPEDKQPKRLKFMASAKDKLLAENLRRKIVRARRHKILARLGNVPFHQRLGGKWW